jgi:hypothetical protein
MVVKPSPATPRREQQPGVALGFKTHIGWAAVVALAYPPAGLKVVVKRRLDIATTFDEGAVYHVGQRLAPAEAIAMISAAERAFERRAVQLVRELVRDLAQTGYDSDIAAIIWGSARPLPPGETILKSHALIHAAEGHLYRSVFARASEANGLRTVRIPLNELPQRARTALGISEAALTDRLVALGKASGRLWGADQKQATLASIVALHERSNRLQPPKKPVRAKAEKR